MAVHQANSVVTAVNNRQQICPVSILGCGSATPKNAVSNDDYIRQHQLASTAEWVETRTGIRQRFVVCPGETNVGLATEAALRALEMARLSPHELDVIIVATSSPDYIMPSTACLVAKNLCISEKIAFDVVNACAGFITAFDLGIRFLQTGCQHILVIGADLGSRLVDPHERTTSIFFGDGAGAVVLGKAENSGLLARKTKTSGDIDSLHILSGESMKMDGKAIWNFATQVLPLTVTRLCQQAGITVQDLNWLIPHQANYRILKHSADTLNLPFERVVCNIDRYANTLAASVPIAMAELWQSGKVKPGDIVCLVGFGAGLAWGGLLLKV